MFAHDGSGQGDVVALLALRKLGVGRRRNAVHGEEVEEHVIPLDSAMAAKFARLRVGFESVRLDQVGPILKVRLEPQRRILSVLCRLNAVVADPWPGHVVERRDALVDSYGPAGTQTGSAAFPVGSTSRRVLLS